MADKTKIAIAGALLEKNEIIEHLCSKYADKPCVISEFSYSKNEENLVDAWAKYDCVILLCSNDVDADEQLKDILVGHSHLRCVEYNKNKQSVIVAAESEIDAVLSGLEIEKKFLIEYPDFEKLKKYKPFKTEISQTYLISNFGSHRIRKRGAYGVFTFFETLKVRITENCCEETERIISESEYNELMKSADPNKNTINKHRYCFLYMGQYVELDVFEFWNDRAILEIELKNIEQKVFLPKEIKVIEDVTDNPKYKNNYLASLKL